MSENQTWHCAVCNEDHPVYTKPVGCWDRDQRRISNLEVAVESLKARVMEGLPIPPRVSPQMGFVAGPCACGRTEPHPPRYECGPTPAEAASPEQGCAHDVREFINVAGRHVFQCIRCGRAGAVPDAAIFERTPVQTERATNPVTRGDRQRLEDVLAGRIYERGGYLPGCACERHTAPSTETTEAKAAQEKTPLERLHDTMRPPLTPAAMLGVAVALSRRASELLDTALKAMPAKDTTGARILVEMAAGESSNAASFAWQAREEMERESKAQRVNCPCGVHGGPGSDACDCAAIAKAERADGAGDRIASRFCNQDGHRWSHGRCAFCGADREMEERRGGPAVDKAKEDA